MLLFLLLPVLPLALATPATASDRLELTIQTQKPFGPAPGTFSTAGAFTDAGAFVNTRFTFSAVAAPRFVIVHVTQTFTGAAGTFTIQAEITETVSADPGLLNDTGTWTVIGGTGDYQTAHGQGSVTGTADDNAGVITRTYAGTVHRT
jgi:hypothetical protein